MYGIPEYKGEIERNILPNSRRTMGTAIMAWTGLPLKDRSNWWRAEHQSLVGQGKNRNKALCDEPRDAFHHFDKLKRMYFKQNATYLDENKTSHARTQTHTEQISWAHTCSSCLFQVGYITKLHTTDTVTLKWVKQYSQMYI